MKNLCIIAGFLLLFVACNKLPKPDTITTVYDTAGDTVTLVDNNNTYNYSTVNNSTVYCLMSKNAYNSTFELEVVGSVVNPVTMLINVAGPINGLGTFKSVPVDSSFSNNNNSFIETFNGGEGYNIDSTTVNISYAARSTIIGTYQVWLTNTGGSKTVTGSINCHSATIN